MLRGLAGILGLSALLTGGGMGDFGRSGNVVLFGITGGSGTSGGVALVLWVPAGEDCLVEELL